MSQRSRGIFSLLGKPSFYDVMQNVVGAKMSRKRFIKEYVAPVEGDRVLDIGCGTGALLEELRGTQYHGFDVSQHYIDAAQKKFAASGTFVCADVLDVDLTLMPSFDIVISAGVLHHLDDDKACALLSLASLALSKESSLSRFVAIDPCYTENQNFIARQIISRDRGMFVRTASAYRKLASNYFQTVEVNVRTDMLKIPYSHCIMVCTLR